MAVADRRKTSVERERRPRRRRDQLILDALEKLLADTPLRDLGVEEIAESARITRTRFYFYFKSKYEAYGALLQRTADTAFQALDIPGSWFQRPPDARPREVLLASLHRGLDAWMEHRDVLREASDLWNAMPQVRSIWQGVLDGLIAATAGAIEREREAGVAPPGVDARLMAQALMWQGERLQFLIAVGAPGMMSLEQLAEVELELWMRTIYLADDPEPAARRGARRGKR
jgi:AcrR family transcriptional regulator